MALTAAEQLPTIGENSVAPQNNMRLVVVASTLGTLIEWYDLLLAVTLANTLSTQFFPAGENKFFGNPRHRGNHLSCKAVRFTSVRQHWR